MNLKLIGNVRGEAEGLRTCAAAGTTGRALLPARARYLPRGRTQYTNNYIEQLNTRLLAAGGQATLRRVTNCPLVSPARCRAAQWGGRLNNSHIQHMLPHPRAAVAVRVGDAEVALRMWERARSTPRAAMQAEFGVARPFHNRRGTAIGEPHRGRRTSQNMSN